VTAVRVAGCPLCDRPGGRVVFESEALRVIHAGEPGFPAFYRVVWQSHVAEWSQLPAAERTRCMDAVVTVEQCLRDTLAPAKINLAALGNAVPHLHWHVIARFEGDSRWPAPVWASAQREADPARERAIELQLPQVEREIALRLATGDS
jgi:diadenosine tetraphosphate (Ap4A) HIT family hydrolase